MESSGKSTVLRGPITIVHGPRRAIVAPGPYRHVYEWALLIPVSALGLCAILLKIPRYGVTAPPVGVSYVAAMIATLVITAALLRLVTAPVRRARKHAERAMSQAWDPTSDDEMLLAAAGWIRIEPNGRAGRVNDSETAGSRV